MAEDSIKSILDAWETNNRVNLLLIKSISRKGMKATLSKRGGRNVVRQFCHLHNVRLWQLENRRAKDLVEGLHKFDTYEEPTKRELTAALRASEKAVAKFLADCAAGRNRRRGFKKGAAAMLAYFVAHDSHHRGNIILTLKASGHAPEQKVRYSLWDWDRI